MGRNCFSLGKEGLFCFLGCFIPGISMCIPVFHLALVWKRNSENHPWMGIPGKCSFPPPSQIRDWGQNPARNLVPKPQIPPSSAVLLPGIIPTSIPSPGLTTKAGKGRQRSWNRWNQTFGSSLLSWAGASSASQLSPGSAHSDEVNQKSPGLIPAAGMAGNKSLWGAGSWIPELSVGNDSLGCAKSEFEGLLGKSVLKNVRF